MNIAEHTQQLPIYSLVPDRLTANKNFRVYNFEGNLPDEEDLLLPHRKNHYLIVLMRKGETRQWIDMTPFTLKSNTIYFYIPNRIIVKESTDALWATGIAFTKEFLNMQGDVSINRLPIIECPQGGHELLLTDNDLLFIEDLLEKINKEYINPNDWQQRMLSACLNLLLTYLSRLYTEQYKPQENSPEKTLLRSYQSKVNESFRELKEVGAYASQLNISAGHLSEVVKMQSGKPAIKHIHERVVLEARRLLFHTNDSLKEIAFDLGFSDASYFNRFFKRETALTPAEYRARIRKMYH
ncbi:AraC family transcriptional regulator [Pedobacter sp. Leaf216]|uniref:helix-turn-helix transcriptional regulator n=1 Tax=Pedobacter sp. Leaf216 TaxID=1735684 RepID=UPI0006F3697C|nr:helix-turn-helix domain-containing protein [Pedobacter sp. Leaf216]KQM77876.1 AraC family transcriptional regulator [Pedobacter sp. Leaf216]